MKGTAGRQGTTGVNGVPFITQSTADSSETCLPGVGAYVYMPLQISWGKYDYFHYLLAILSLSGIQYVGKCHDMSSFEKFRNSLIREIGETSEFH